MGPPLRPDPTTPAYLMDLLAKYVNSSIAIYKHTKLNWLSNMYRTV